MIRDGKYMPPDHSGRSCTDGAQCSANPVVPWFQSTTGNRSPGSGSSGASTSALATRTSPSTPVVV